MSFVHLKLHTEYSLVDGLVRVGPLVERVAELQMPAVAVTDVSNMFGLIKFYKKSVAAGIKPIVGCDLRLRTADGGHCVITVLAQDNTGYAGLRELISRGWLEGQAQGEAFIERDWLESRPEGLIVLSGGRHGDVGQALSGGRIEDARRLVERWRAVFGDRYYLELQRTGREGDEDHLHQAVELALATDVPVVATNDVRFLGPAEFEAHEARVCIHEGRTLDDPRRPRQFSAQQYLRSPEEMAELFADIPEALENSVQIARRCNVEIELGKYRLPDYPVPAGMDMDTFFRRASHDGLEVRLAKLFEPAAPDFPATRERYRQRLDFELDTIIQMGFTGYFLIVMDFIKWAKSNAIPVGPGRGSGAGSLVAYALDITDLDPLQYDLLFERFLNPERVSMPDFDVDFCMDNRDRVIAYVADRYGREAVSQIITFGTMAAKAVVRDVARVQGKSYGLADKLSKMIPFEVGITLDKAFDSEQPLRDFLAEDSQAMEIWEMAVQLEGLTRNVGKHAGGVVIAPSKLTDFSPLYSDEKGGNVVTQFDKGDVEDAGLVKFDFLGLRTLTIIDWAVKMINRAGPDGISIGLDLNAIPLDDPATFAMLKRAETTAVFQLESRGMKDLIKRLQPDSLEDMIALMALFRPGPLDSGMVDDFVNRKHGRAQVAYPDPKYQHACLKPILEPTYGVIVYQEQVMQIAQELAGYTLGGADLLRRAMGKKKPEEMAKQRAVFAEGARRKNIDPDLAMRIFDLVEKFAGYGFNKSHSAAYALVSYQTAWLKAHFPAQFMAATMSSEMHNTDKVVTFIEDCRNIGLTVNLPDVNEGEFMFTVNSAGEIVYGLGAIKGLGEGPVQAILEARQAAGPFTDLFDFCARVDGRRINRKALEALVHAGAFDRLGADRAILMAALPDAVKAAEQNSRNAEAGMFDLFGEVTGAGPADTAADVYAGYRRFPPWSTRQRLAGEKETLGLYVTGHPIDDYEDELPNLVSTRIVNLKQDQNPQLVAGLVVALRMTKTKRGESIAFATLDDRTGRIEVSFFAEVYQQVRQHLTLDRVVAVEGIVSPDDYSGGLKARASGLRTLPELRVDKAVAIEFSFYNACFPADFERVLVACAEPARGDGRGCPVVVNYGNGRARGRVRLSTDWRIFPTDDVLAHLRTSYGAAAVRMLYRDNVRPLDPGRGFQSRRRAVV